MDKLARNEPKLQQRYNKETRQRRDIKQNYKKQTKTRALTTKRTK
jgi:hypothetical protein